ncbi:MAG: acetyl-CoA carboxylase carboxyltransferase subunit alpha [Thermodesulfobacteriota bacterium]
MQRLDFESAVEKIEEKIERLKISSGQDKASTKEEIKKLQHKADKILGGIYAKLTPWQITQVARHPQRPYTMDYIQNIFEGFIELHGDRCFSDDPAMVCGLAKFNGDPVVVMGHQKGRTIKEKVRYNFGMPHPEGFRKSLRLMDLAVRFSLPVFTFIDTPGAYPGVGAEERGQSEAIAANLMKMAGLRTPIISTVIGEGGSGGALAIGVADRVLMLEFATYSVISPEGCAAILWKDGTKGSLAANALKIDAENLLKSGVVDRIVPEPTGGAHRNTEDTFNNLKAALTDVFAEIKHTTVDKLVKNRYNKFRSLGLFTEN